MLNKVIEKGTVSDSPQCVWGRDSMYVFVVGGGYVTEEELVYDDNIIWVMLLEEQTIFLWGWGFTALQG